MMNLPESLRNRLAHWQLDCPVLFEPVSGTDMREDGAGVSPTTPTHGAWPLPELAKVAILSEN